jgi:hypothetical protein
MCGFTPKPLARTAPGGSALIAALSTAALALTAALLTAAASPASAQGILGRVMDADADTALAGVAVTLVDSDGSRLATATTDTTGSFGLPVYQPGIYTLHLAHVAYEAIDTRALAVERQEVVHVDIRLSRLAFELDPLVVTARQRASTSYLTEYYERLDRWEEYGRGVILTRDELEKLEGFSVGDILKRPTLTRRFLNRRGLEAGLPCTPVLYWNGFEMPASEIPISSVEAIEIYRPSETPPQYSTGGCAAVLVWNRPIRPGEDDDRAPGWQRAALAVGAGVLFVFLVW